MKYFKFFLLTSMFTSIFPSSGLAISKESFTIGTIAEFESLQPVIATQAAAHYMIYMTWRPLVYLDQDNKWQTSILTKVPTIENKSAKRKGQGLEVNIEIIEKAVWGDGTPITCKDIEFGRKVLVNKNVSIAARDPYENVEKITWDEKKPKKCQIILKVAKFDFFYSLPEPLPAHIEEPVFEKHKDQSEGYDRNTLYVKQPNTPGLYNGPYMISEVKLGSHVVLVRNPKYFGKAPYFDKIIYKLIASNNTFEANLRSGILDMVSPPGGMSLDQATEFESKIKADKLPYKAVFEDGVIYSHLELNMANPILADLRVRKALSHGFSKEEMIKTLIAGKARPAISNVSPRDPWFTSKVPTYSYNKREAIKLLEEAGWKKGPDGIRVKDGKKLTLNLMSVSGAKVNEMVQVYLQNQYRQIGIEITIKNEPARVFFGETTTHRKFDIAFFAWGSIAESSPRSTLHSTMIPTDKNAWSGQNYTGINIPELDKLIDQLEQELDANKRKAISHKIQAIYAREIPVIPMYFRQNTGIIPAGLKGYRMSGHSFYETLEIEKWSL